MNTPLLGYNQLSPAAAARVDEICDRFERLWQAVATGGAVPRIALFLEGVAENERLPLLRELIAVDRECRELYGHPVQPEEYQALLPPGAVAETADFPRPEDRPRGPHSDEWPAVPGFAVQEVLGVGGTSVVYRARQAALERDVAIKMLRDANLRNASLRERFDQEARAIARLQHAHLVRVYEFGAVPGHAGSGARPYLVLEYVAGGSLADRLRGTPLPPAEAARLVETLAGAIQYAHEQGIIHRDLKPGNVLLASGGRKPPVREDEKERTCREGEKERTGGLRPPLAFEPKITDFGLAQLESGATLTRTGDILGTPSYMAPEQTTGTATAVTAATDVYGLGAIFYECLTGRPPFRAETALATLIQVQRDEPVSPRRLQPTVPLDLNTICLKCLHKEPARRYATARELADDLHRFLDGRPILARPAGLVSRTLRHARRRPATTALLVGLLLVTLVGLAGIVWQAGRANQKRQEAEAARAEAEKRSYFDRINRAYQAYWWQTGERTEQLLAECKERFPGYLHWEYRYLERLSRDGLLTIEAHDDVVYDMVYSADGKQLATGTGQWADKRPGEIKVWDAATGQLLHPPLRGHKHAVYTLAFQPGGRRLASGGLDRIVLLWNLDRPQEEPTRVEVEGSVVFKLVFGHDGRQLFAACSDGKVRVLNPATGRIERTLHGHPGANVFAITLSRDGRFLASGGRDGRICVWDLTSDAPPRHLTHFVDVRRLAFSPDGQILASGSYDGVLALWNLKEDPPRPLCVTLDNSIVGLAFHPDGRTVAVNNADGHVRLIQVRGGSELRTLRGQGGRVTTVAFSPDGRTLAAATWTGRVKLWDMTAPSEVPALSAADGKVSALALSPDAELVASAGIINRGNFNQGTFTAWLVRPRTGEPVHVFKGHHDDLTCVAYRPDGRQVATGSADKTVRLWNVATGGCDHVLPHSEEVTGVAYDPTSTRVVTASTDGTLRLWDTGTGAPRLVFTGHTDRVNAVAFTPDGRHIVSGSADRTARVWEVTTGREVLRFPEHTGSVTDVACSPTADLVASADGHAVYLWDWRTGQLKPTRPIQLGPTITYAGEERNTTSAAPVVRLAFSPDGQRLATVNTARPLQLWDTASGWEALSLPDVPRGCVDVAFSPVSGDDRLFVGIQQSVYLWDPNRRPDTREDQAKRTPEWHLRELNSAAVLPKADWATVFHATALLESDPNQVSLLLRRGAAHAGLGQAAEAFADLDRAAALARADDTLETHRGDAFVKFGRWGEAIAAYRRTVDRKPGDFDRWSNLAIACLGAGRADEYRAVCAEMREHFALTEAGFPPAGTYVLAPLAELPDAAALLAHLRKTYAKGGGERVLGVAYYRTGEFDQAEKLFRAPPASSLRAWDWLFLAMCCHHSNRPQESRACVALARAWIRDADAVATDPRAYTLPRWISWRERVEVLTLLRETEGLLSLAGGAKDSPRPR